MPKKTLFAYRSYKSFALLNKMLDAQSKISILNVRSVF